MHLHEKSREVCIKARSPATSLALVAKHTTVKWPILRGNICKSSVHHTAKMKESENFISFSQ